MTDNEKKDIAERLLKLIDGTSNGIVLSAAIQKIADELYPPRPAPGQVAVTRDNIHAAIDALTAALQEANQ